MIDSRTATQKAFFAALNGNVEVTTGAAVWAPPPEGTEATPTSDVVIIGLASVVAAGGKDGGFDEVEIEVRVFVRKPDPTQLYARSNVVRNALEGQDVAAVGALLSQPEMISAESDMMDDGETFFDLMRFRTFVQPA